MMLTEKQLYQRRANAAKRLARRRKHRPGQTRTQTILFQRNMVRGMRSNFWADWFNLWR